MNIDDFLVFRIVSKHENVSKAAAELNFVQSSVTSKIKRLEAHYNTQLFYRHRHGVSLTPAGQTLLVYTEKILHLFAESEKNLIDSDLVKGPLSIGSMETTAAVRLPIPLAAFNKQFPDVALSLKTGPTEELIKLVRSYQLDGAFVASNVKYEGLVFEPVIEEELLLIANDAQALQQDRLKESTLLVFKRGCSYRKLLEEWLSNERIIPHKVMEFGSLEAILGCVNAGLGISLLPKSIVSNYQQQYIFAQYELPNEFGKVHTSFVSRKDVTKTLAVDKLLTLVKEKKKELSM